jgi:hypothetical protein
LEETTSRLIKIKKYIRYGFFLIIPILNFEVQKSKTCYFVNKLVMVLYSKVFFFLWSGRVQVQFLTNNSRMSIFQVGETDVEQLSQRFTNHIDKDKPEKKSTKKPRSI